MSTLVRSSLLAAAVLALVGIARPALAVPPAAEVAGVVNLNTATESELRRLPGIGPSKAQRIVEARQKRKFDTTDQIMRVKGIGRKTYRKLKPHLAVHGATTLERRPKPTKAPRTPGENASPGPVDAADRADG